jgi:hypothetical protein
MATHQCVEVLAKGHWESISELELDVDKLE